MAYNTISLNQRISNLGEVDMLVPGRISINLVLKISLVLPKQGSNEVEFLNL